MNTTATLAIICGEAEHSALIFPTSSALALRVYQALEDPDCNAKTATRLIQAEPLLSARIVAIANSAAFNRSHVLVSNVRVGITRLGFKMVRMLAMSMVVDQMDGKSDLAAHQGLAQRLWEHTAHVAALAQVIARRITHQNPEAAMFAGMVPRTFQVCWKRSASRWRLTRTRVRRKVASAAPCLPRSQYPNPCSPHSKFYGQAT